MSEENKPFRCGKCNRRFATKSAKKQHQNDVHGANLWSMPKKVRAEIAMEAFGDLPDGAFFAASQEMFGLDPEDFGDLED